MSTVITETQARKITGGRKPLVPVEYEAALKALAVCESIDDTKYWASKADALAAWARIYKDDEAGISARRLKLHAYRRMGELAAELRPPRPKKGVPRAERKGPRSLLKEHGLSSFESSRVLSVSRAPKQQFDEAVRKGQGIQRTAYEARGKSGTSEAWGWLTRNVLAGARLHNVVTAFRSRSARQVALGINSGEVASARKLLVEIQEWLDEFEQCLPKSTTEG